MSIDPLHPKIDAYLHRIVGASDPVAQEMERLAAKRNFPIVGPLVGRLLFQQTKIINAKRVLELGSGYGYSALWFAQAVGKDGTVICTERSADNVRLGKAFLANAEAGGRVQWHVGDALELLNEIEGEFDLVFNDVDKAEYPEAFRRAERHLRIGGLFISDNMLWWGKVAEPDPDESTRGVQELTRLLLADKRYATTIIPLRDGVSISVRLE